MAWAANEELGLCNLLPAGWNTTWIFLQFVYLEHIPTAEDAFPSVKHKPAVLSETLSWCFSSFSTLIFFTNMQLQIQVKTKLLHLQSGLKEGLTCPVALFPRAFSLGQWLLLHGIIYSLYTPISWPSDLVSSVSPAPWLSLSITGMWRATLVAQYIYQQHCHVALLWYFHLWGFSKTWQPVFPCLCTACFFKSSSSLLSLIS